MDRKKGTVKKGIDADDARRRRENHAIQIRKGKQAEQVIKHRKVSGQARLCSVP
jgi:hypothetical protein